MQVDISELGKLQFHFVKVLTRVFKKKHYVSKFAIHTVESNEESEFNLTNNDALSYVGYLKTIDPISKSAILCNIENDCIKSNILVLGHTITSITNYTKEGTLTPEKVENIVKLHLDQKLANHSYNRLTDSDKSYTKEELDTKRSYIIECLKLNRISASLNGTTGQICVEDVIKISPPYERESDFICPTSLILKRIRGILELN